MSNEKIRKEFEAWVKDDIGVDCSKMPYGQFKGDIEPQYHNESDPDGAMIVSSMLAAWQASRAAAIDDGYCIVPSETIKKAYVLASSVCGDCYAGEDTESLLANQLTKEISKSEYWMSAR